MFEFEQKRWKKLCLLLIFAINFTVNERGTNVVGEPPQKIADDLLAAVLRDDKEDTPLSFKFSHWLRVTFPAFFHFMMAKRAQQTTTAATADNNQRF